MTGGALTHLWPNPVTSGRRLTSLSSRLRRDSQWEKGAAFNLPCRTTAVIGQNSITNIIVANCRNWNINIYTNTYMTISIASFINYTLTKLLSFSITSYECNSVIYLVAFNCGSNVRRQCQPILCPLLSIKELHLWASFILLGFTVYYKVDPY